ncbi:CD109 antigen [Eurytemora carolleeae]|uniref:CD109 antigen n=1 Tax=Eurytemora carolleeae TaxID=1294199 RepID=UPI000C782DBE|nr:CD109 antigen [Eurytemora carolleeae]|eukprot:XP_023346769.1 CD109 antigen-like [Eurytemora affinis]
MCVKREGEIPDSVTYYPAMDYGIDSNRTLELQDLIVFTDYVGIPQTPLTRYCANTTGLNPCMLTGCFTEEQRCNGIADCEDGYDESNCGDHSRIKQELTYRYRLSRMNRFDSFYDISDGDWGWINTNIDEDHEEFRTLDVPETAEEWFFTAFSVSKTYGLSILEEFVSFSSYRPIWLYCEGPGTIRRGETVGIKCTVFNWGEPNVECMLNLRGSDDYEFVHVEEFGYVVSYNPRTSKGDHHHLLYIRGDTTEDVHFPIKPMVQQGTITVTVELSTQIVHLTQEVEIEIIGEGSLVHRHTSVVLDLKNRANELEFMDIIVDETEIIPYEIYRRYISGSPKGLMTLSGDVIGPTFSGGEPVSLYTMFPTGHGKYGKGTEFHLFNLAANSWQLHYHRLTNQWQDLDPGERSSIFQAMNLELAAVMRRYSTQGYLTMFDYSPPSVWLTAWCIRIFKDVGFQDWEDYIYIDPQIYESSVLWLINFQDVSGFFVETEYIQVPFLLHMDRKDKATNSSNHVALTAHVLIALHNAASRLTGHVTKYCSTARQAAVRYLERNLDHLTDPYEMAISAYALTVTQSSESEEAYNKLFSMRREEGGMSYWSRTRIETNKVRYQFNRPFLEPKAKQENDALAVEATGYALLTLFRMDGGGITFLQDQIVKWLNTMRLGVGGFISTVDTIISMEALVRYAYHNNIKDLSNMYVNLDLPDSNFTKTFHILREGRLSCRDLPIFFRVSSGIEIPIENVWGHVNLRAWGAGQAVAQLDLTYGIDYPPLVDSPPKRCFDLTIKETFSGRNKSNIMYTSCIKWTCLDDGPQSGFAMLVLDIPSGYLLLQPDALQIVRSKKIPQLVDADMEKEGKTIWYFDHIPAKTQCFDQTITRYYPVANLSRTRQALIIEPQRPEKFFIRTFNSTALYILSVCEVCGSYQCPYCPYYSGGANFINFSFILSTIILILSSFIHT